MEIRNVEKLNDERGIRTPEMWNITGLAIPRHTGLGYLVTEMIWKFVFETQFIYLILSREVIL